MGNKYTIIILNGFRATGKSTIGSKVAEKLGWDYLEIDQEIVKRAGKSIPEITNNGISWQLFRQMEHDLFKELLSRENLVVSAGGGLTVNNVLEKGTSTTFGELNLLLLQDIRNALVVLVTASEESVERRIREIELAKAESTRPILDEKRAQEVQALLDLYKSDKEKQKEILVEEIVRDSLHIYRMRKPLYERLSSFVVDTSDISIDEAVLQVLNWMD
jgi:shikimate kinase